MTRPTRRLVALGLGTAALGGLATAFRHDAEAAGAEDAFPVRLSEAEWRRKLGPDRYAILRKSGTERAGTSPLDGEKRAGTFACAGCDTPLFSSATKFDSRTGWPSFYQPLPGSVGEASDRSYGMTRTSVHCARCGGHLGHVFRDGPPPTGLRYCMNGLAMTFRPGAP